MRNPTYAGDYQRDPMPARVAAISVENPANDLPTLSMGIKTITHNRDGMKLHPTKVVAVEMSTGEELASFDLSPSLARHYGHRLLEFADVIESKQVF